MPAHRRAGYRLKLALDVFVHHFGSRTFLGLGVNGPRQLHDNLQRFLAKWGREHAAVYRLPPAPTGQASWAEEDAVPVGGAIVATGTSPSTARSPAAVVVSPRLPAQAGDRAGARISLCVMARNEQANLAACLGPVMNLVGEAIVVDTGSTDRTREIARGCGARVFDFPWCDSFAAGRNETLRHATGDWIFWLDADDRIDEDNHAKLRAQFADLRDENVGYVMKVASGPLGDSSAARVVDQIRLFRNHPQIRWEYRVHEQILAAICRQGGVRRWTDVVVQHVGYLDPVLVQRKHGTTCGCCTWTWPTAPATPLRCSTWAGPVRPWGGTPRRCRICVRLSSSRGPTTALCASSTRCWPRDTAAWASVMKP